jgi:flagellar basal-body rod modification protein FlgD
MTTTTPVTSTPVSPPPNSPAAPAATSDTADGTDPTGTLNFTQNFDTFLTLLTTQLQNQDPLSPMDTSQFTQQLVSFASVEQQIKTNSNLATMIAGQSASEAVAALPMVGRSIEYSGNQLTLQNGQAGFSYTLPTTATTASVIVQDANGNSVYSSTVDPTAGKHSLVWNGQTTGGQQLPDGGTYTIQVVAADSKNNPITATTTGTGAVTGVSVANNVATFDVGNVQVPMNQLITIVSTPATASN